MGWLWVMGSLPGAARMREGCSCCQQRECTVGTWVGARVGRGRGCCLSWPRGGVKWGRVQAAAAEVEADALRVQLAEAKRAAAAVAEEARAWRRASGAAAGPDAGAAETVEAVQASLAEELSSARLSLEEGEV